MIGRVTRFYLKSCKTLNTNSFVKIPTGRIKPILTFNAIFNHGKFSSSQNIYRFIYCGQQNKYQTIIVLPILMVDKI